MSMFRTFRKNQKTWLTTLGVLAMFSFVFIPTFQNDGSSSGGAKSKVVTTRLFGDLSEVDMHNLLVQRQTFVAFLDSLVQEYSEKSDATLKKLFESGKSMEDPELMLQMQKAQQTIRDISFFRQQIARYDERVLVNGWLQARYAERAGVVVSDGMIIAFMKKLMGNEITTQMVQEAKQKIGLSNPKVLDDFLREELLASEYRRQFEVNFQGLPLSRQWDYFCRVYRSATIDAAPVAVMDYVAKVAEPSQEEMMKFFEENKNTLADAFLGTPGFKNPKKVKVQYMVANLDKFADPASITPEAIRAEYDRIKDFSFVKQPGEDLKVDTANPFVQGQENAPAPEVPDVTLPENAAPAESTPALPETIDLQETPAPAPAEEAKPAEAAPAPVEEAKPAEAAPAPAPAEEAKPAEGAQAAHRGPFRQVAFPGNIPPQAGVSGTNYTTQAPKEYRPLSEVEGQIRESLARTAAIEKILKATDDATTELTAFDRAIRKYEAKVYRNEGKPIDEAKPVFDFAAMANKYGFDFVEVPLADELELLSVPIGMSRCEQGTYVTYILGTVPTYQPIRSFDMQDNIYLSWKTEEVESNVPNFSDAGVKDRVVAAWKFDKARSLAKAEAERLAAECGKAGNLTALGDKVFASGPFHWLTYGSILENQHSVQEPQISEVKNVDTDTRKNAGENFMKAVFSLKEGEVGVAEDLSRSTYYVVQLKEFLPKDDVLQNMFAESPLDYYRTAANADLRAVAQSWLEQLATDAGLEWIREPRDMRGE
ncbi:MAG: hypothetical protein Q4D98_07450 [Planctomycetia bacterium]|nr:hypothetical protein [Planctomycetia bacterium]